MPYVFRMAGSDLVWELREDADVTQISRDLAESLTAGKAAVFSARLPAQAAFSSLYVNASHLAWWSLGPEGPSPDTA